jgi:hypothetical protein
MYRCVTTTCETPGRKRMGVLQEFVREVSLGGVEVGQGELSPKHQKIALTD